MTRPARHLRIAVLAGARAGEADGFGSEAGHKALTLLAGRPLIDHVFETLAASGLAEPYLLLGEEALMRRAPGVDAAFERGDAVALAPAGSPSMSVARALATIGTDEDLLIVTADHPLLTPEMIAAFLAGADPAAAAVAAAVAETAFRARFGDARRTFLRFSDTAISGANLFLLRGAAAAPAVAFWRNLERNRKRPLAMARALGPVALIRFAFRRLSLAGAEAALSRKAGAQAQVVLLAQAEAAVDVDKPEDLVLAGSIMTARAAAGRAVQPGA